VEGLVNICIIPARGGSKRIKGKNTIQFMGKPLIQWTIEAATGAVDYFSRMVVATDDERVRDVVSGYAGWEIFHLTPEQASDTAGMLTAVKAVLAADDVQYGGVCILPPTAPLRDTTMIRNGMKYWEETGCRRLMLAARYNLPPWQGLMRGNGNEWEPMWGKEALLSRSQAWPELLCDAGAMYVLSPDDLEGGVYGEGLRLMQIPIERAADIDDYQSLVFAATLKRGIA
jgi:pseudaminic acid cytidylyltransferase